MGVRAHVRQLNIRHSDIDKALLNEMKRTRPDEFRISQLKKEKLHLKDKIASYGG